MDDDGYAGQPAPALTGISGLLFIVIGGAAAAGPAVRRSHR